MSQVKDMSQAENMSEKTDKNVSEQMSVTSPSQGNPDLGNRVDSSKSKKIVERVTEESLVPEPEDKKEFLTSLVESMPAQEEAAVPAQEEVAVPAQGQQGPDVSFKVFQITYEKFETAEEKLGFAIEFMRTALAQTGSPQFKEFWEVKRLCIQLFKESLKPAFRVQSWTEYSEICSEARRLKEILDEESAFAVEQIDIAISSIEDGITNFERELDGLAAIPFPENFKALETKLEVYSNMQKSLNLLNTFAAKINGLRKELIKTEMRIRFKNKFFQRLSVAGDKVFPKRKQLIKEVSELFLSDVDLFVQEHFSSDTLAGPLYFYREEIKAFQGVAKVLTLNTQAFTATRGKLSDCWDKVKRLEKEWKKEKVKQRAAYKENAQSIHEQIVALQTSIKDSQLNHEQINDEVNEIFSVMKSVDLGRDEVKRLRDELQEIRFGLRAEQKEEGLKKERELQEKERLKREEIQSLKDSIKSLLENIDTLSLDDVESQHTDIQQRMSAATLHPFDKQALDRLSKPLKYALADKQEKAMLELSDDDMQSIDQLKQVLKQRKSRRNEIKSQIEVNRKAAGSSGLDFEKAMQSQEMMIADKERLQKISEGITEIEQQIQEIKSRS